MDKPQLIEGVSVLEQRMQGRDRIFTIGDAAAITGFSIDDAKQALDRLMQMYDCRLKVTENGDLIYDFGDLHKRGERTWEEWWHLTKLALWKTFVIVFKIWITITLVVYFAIFLVILIAIIVAMMAGDKDSSSSSSSNSGGGFFNFLGDIFQSIFIWNTHTSRTYYETDSRGYTYQTYESRGSALDKKKNKKGKGFVASVYDFVFGPDRVEMTREEQQKEIASYVRQNKGVITLPEVIALGGWNRPKGEDFFSEVIVKYQGDSKITENAVLYGDFYELARSQSSGGESPIVWYWDEYVPEYKLTGNTFWRNFAVVGMNLFNLLFATVFVVGLSQESGGDAAILIGLGWIPFIFSMLFFTVPILRSFQIAPLRRKRNLENIRKRLMKAIYLNNSAEISLEILMNAVNSQNKGEEKLNQADVEKMMQTLINDFDGEIELKDSGQIVYKFQNLREEIKEAQTLRIKRDSGRDLGKIIADTQED